MYTNKLTSIFLLSLVTGCLGGENGVDDTGETGDTGAPNTFTDGLELELTNFGGCGDVFMYAYSDSDEMGLFISAAGIVQQAFDSGDDTSTFSVDVGSGDGQARVVLQAGERITTEACNDLVIYDQRPAVSEELTATAGTITFQITPSGEPTDWGELPAGGDVLLNEVEFTTIQGDTLTIDNWGFNAYVGWLPG